MIIAVDFDGCLCEAKWPDIGKPHKEVILYLRYRQMNGDRLILWTCREGEQLDEAVLWCRNHGLSFDAVNDNLPDNIRRFGNNSRKIYADEYWGDKSVMVMRDTVCYLTSNGRGRRSLSFFGRCRFPREGKRRPYALKWFRELMEGLAEEDAYGAADDGRGV